MVGCSAHMELSKILMVLILFLIADTAVGSDSSRRTELKAFAQNEFKSSNNHCQSFAKVAEYATTLTISTSEFLEDMRLVIIGSDWSRKKDKRGDYYIGIVTSDSGFKPELKDGSSQVEHLMAAIYFGKMLPPGGAAIGGSLIEVRDQWKRNAHYSKQDAALYMLGGDIGERLHDRELKLIGTPIRRTICVLVQTKSDTA